MDGSKKHRGRTVYRHSSGAGFLLLNSSFEPIYANDDAVQILAYPKGPREIGSRDGALAEQLRSVLCNGHSSPRFPLPTAFLSGRRHYHCRAFPLESNSTNPSDATVVLFERRPWGSVNVAQIAAFQLTDRERETVGFLLEGLTSKEIAQRMHISPHTVKAFIRFVMVKMDVSTRSGIIGKILKTVSKSDEDRGAIQLSYERLELDSSPKLPDQHSEDNRNGNQHCEIN